MSSRLEPLYHRLPVMIQNFVVSLYGHKLKKERFTKGYADWMAFFERSQRWSLSELEAYQDEKLRALIAFVYEYVPYYREAMRKKNLTPQDIKTQRDLPKLPVLTKEIVRARYNDLIARNVKKEKLKQSPTSGTTGTPMTFLWDRTIDVLNNAAIWRHKMWANFYFGEPYASLLGRVIVPIAQKKPPFWRFNRSWNQLFLSSFHLREENLATYFDVMDKYHVKAIDAYPSTVYILAQYLRSRNLFFPLKVVFTSSETLLPIQREIIEERFQCEVFDGYGLSEGIIFSSECQYHDGHHIFMEYGVTEIVNEQGELVESDAHGRLIGTGLHNLGMPLIRYDTGDISAHNLSKCRCGRSLKRMDAVTTKAEDIIVLENGMMISSSILTHPFKPLTNVLKSQIIQEEPNKIVIKIVRGAGYTEDDTNHLQSEFRKRLGENVEVAITYVPDIPRSARGKYRWVISKVPLRYGNKVVDNLFSEAKGVGNSNAR